MIDYSVIIRTTGNAGEKYKRLLDSIKNLEPQPKEIIVVLPEGYSLPKEQIGNEIYYFCPKGMVLQRLVGIEKCKTQYALISDDDIEFEKDFVEKLAVPLVKKNYSLSAGPLIEFFPNRGIPTIFSTLLGTAVPTVLHKNRYNTVLRTTGYSFNRNIGMNKGTLLETQTAAWTCFFANVKDLRSIHFEDEMWLDMCGYSAHDDTAMFYKAWLYNKKTVIVADAKYKHLDARTSTKGNLKKVEFAKGFNSVVFWHRFIYTQQTTWILKKWSYICIQYHLTMQKIFNALKYARKKMLLEEKNAFLDGIKEGFQWLKNNEYQELPPVLRSDKNE